MRSQICLACLLFALFPGTQCLADDIDECVRAEMQRQHIPGVSIGIVRRGELVRAQGYGFANLEWRAPATPHTVYQSGSMGKQFTAAAMLLLAQQQRLNFDDPLTKYFPQAPARLNRITLRHLLAHTSGLHDYGVPEIDFRRDYTEDEIAGILLQQPLDFEPGTRWQYSNTGYVLSGVIIGKVAGLHWSKFLAEQVFRPLGMNSSRMIDEAEVIPN